MLSLFLFISRISILVVSFVLVLFNKGVVLVVLVVLSKVTLILDIGISLSLLEVGRL